MILCDNKEVIKSLLKTIVNDDRLNKHENGEKNLENISIENLKNSVFKGITNIVGHDATPIGLRGGIYNIEQQRKYYNEIKILFIDEWQGEGEAKCVKIETDEKGENIISFYREKNEINNETAKFVESDFDNNKKVKIILATAELNSTIDKNEEQSIENANKETNNIFLTKDQKIEK